MPIMYKWKKGMSHNIQDDYMRVCIETDRGKAHTQRRKLDMIDHFLGVTS